eukprot:3757959-Amphidinium_carterae.1
MRREYAIHFSWLDTALMLSDCLTKLEFSKEYFRKCFMDCYWDSRCTEETRATKALLQAQRRARKQRLRSSQGAAMLSTVDGSIFALARVAVDTGDSRHGSAWENRKVEAGSGSSGLPNVE